VNKLKNFLHFNSIGSIPFIQNIVLLSLLIIMGIGHQPFWIGLLLILTTGFFYFNGIAINGLFKLVSRANIVLIILLGITVSLICWGGSAYIFKTMWPASVLLTLVSVMGVIIFRSNHFFKYLKINNISIWIIIIALAISVYHFYPIALIQDGEMLFSRS